MSTRSMIGKVLADRVTIKAIYCHFDGYPEHNGKILVNNYNDEQKIDALIALGDLSSLGQEIGEKVDFNDRDATFAASRYQCVAYGRDRGETDIEARTFHSLRYVVERQSDAEYIYIWNGQTWACYKPSGKMIDLYYKDADNDMA